MVNFELTCWLEKDVTCFVTSAGRRKLLGLKQRIDSRNSISLSDALLLSHREIDGEPGYSKCRYVVYIYFEIVRTMNNPLTWSPLISPKESWKRTSSPSRKDKIPKIHPRHKPSNIILLVRMPYLRKKRVSGIFWAIFNWMSKSK